MGYHILAPSHRGPAAPALTADGWPGVPGNDGLAARLAHQPGAERVTAAVGKDRRRPVRAGQVAVAPLTQGQDDGVEILADVGQVVLEAGRVIGRASCRERV